jgi:hypothetical protein
MLDLDRDIDAVQHYVCYAEQVRHRLLLDPMDRALEAGPHPRLSSWFFRILSITQARKPPLPQAGSRIGVVKVDALMALCDALEARLKERAVVQGQLAGAVMKQVAG